MIEFGDCRETMRRWKEQGVKAQTCVTSPPYYGLRDYGHDGQIGLEETPEQYIKAMVEVFRCVWDVLEDNGTLWLNIGDSYYSNTKGSGGASEKQDSNAGSFFNAGSRFNAGSLPLKPKDLIGIPWMLAFALRADGWYLRQDIIWHKPNPMPESVTDRCTKAHEYIFLLSKSARYYFDADAIAEPVSQSMLDQIEQGYDGTATKDFDAAGLQDASAVKSRILRRFNGSASGKTGANGDRNDGGRSAVPLERITRNKRSVWTVTTKPYKGAHFATFPPALIEPCILAGAPAGGVVLDPFMGSGTTAAVAIANGRNYLGCELNSAYKELQDIRILDAHLGAAQMELI